MYCTLADIVGQSSEAALIKVTDDAGLDVVDESKVTMAIQNAQAEIDAYAQVHYPVPFNPVPEMIRKVAVDLALYNLFSRRGFDPEGRDKAIKDRYDNAARFLKDLARGLIQLGAPAPTPAAGARIESSPRLFSRHSLEGL